MPVEPATSSPAIVGVCRGCGYALQGLTSHRCPECGREFDPNDPKTMRFGREPGFFGRLVLRQLPWPLVLLLMIAATLAICIATRPQVGRIRTWDLATVDLELFLLRAPRDLSLLVTSSDCIYAAGLWAWMLLLAVLWTWRIFRGVARIYFRVKSDINRSALRRLLISVLLLTISFVCVVVGWPYRLGRHVAAKYINLSQQADGKVPLAWLNAPFPMLPFRSGTTCQERIVQSAIQQAPDPQERIAGLAMAQVLRPYVELPLVRDGSRVEQDPAVLEWEIRLLGIHSDPELKQVVDRYLASPDARLRMAALEAVAFANEWPTSTERMLASTPKIPVVAFWVGRRGSHLNFSAATQARIAEIMAKSTDETERETAAVAWQATLKDLHNPHSLQPLASDWPLRVAEWGVWIDAGNLASADQATDDIPPFVHNYSDFFWSPSSQSRPPAAIVAKPVIHFYCDRPQALTISTYIDRGRVNFVFPKPDQYITESSNHPFGTQTLENLVLPKGGQNLDQRYIPTGKLLADPAPGANRLQLRYPGAAISVPDYIRSIGYHWDSLMLFPQQQPWMRLPLAPSDAKYAWWPGLRQVPGAWVHNRGETERFLYYDGPSYAVPTVRVRMRDRGFLWIDAPSQDRPKPSSDFGGCLFQTARQNRSDERRGLYIHVANGGVAGEIVPVPIGDGSPVQPTYAIGSAPQLTGEKLEATLRDWAIDAGLTSAEANGMLVAWRETFFHKPGQRFVMLMSANDYDWLCPIQIRPRPQTLARVGLVWTELKPEQLPATQPGH